MLTCPYSIDQVKLINGFLFHRVGHKVFIALGHLDSWNNLSWKELLGVIYSNLSNTLLSSKLCQVAWGLLSFEKLQGQRFHNLFGLSQPLWASMPVSIHPHGKKLCFLLYIHICTSCISSGNSGL